MGFVIYTKQSENRAVFASACLLNGTTGLLSRYLQTLEADISKCNWRLSMQEVLNLYYAQEITNASASNSNSGDSESMLVFDATPTTAAERAQSTALVMYRVHEIAGETSSDETNLVLVLEPLLGCQFAIDAEAGDKRSAPMLQWKRFGDSQFEPLGLTGGYDGGTFRWTEPSLSIGGMIVGGKKPE